MKIMQKHLLIRRGNLALEHLTYLTTMDMAVQKDWWENVWLNILVKSMC